MADELFLGRVLPVIFLLSGAGLTLGAARLVMRTRAFLATARQAIGEVIALKEEPPMEPGERSTYRPVVAFRPGGSERIEFESIAHANPPEYEIGASVTVLYDPDRPGDARIRSFVSLWLLPIILGGLGIVFLAVGSGVLVGSIPP